MTAPTSANTVRVPCGDRGTTLRVADVFISFDLPREVAYLVHDCNSMLRWREISRPEAELLVVMGAHAQVVMEDASGDGTAAIDV